MWLRSARFRRSGTAAVVAALAFTLVRCGPKTKLLPPCDDSPAVPALAARTVVRVAAAGDIADCHNHDAHRRTAATVRALAPDLVLALGDLAYPNSSLDDLVDCYGSSWGAFRSITRPTIGNHEYHTEHGGPFFAYFCGAVGEGLRGYYSFDAGPWHVVALNSNCGNDLDVPPGIPDEFGGCGADSPQARWLEADLAAHPSACTLAMWHHPRFTSGSQHGNGIFMTDLWRVLDRHHVDLVLSGHVHNYERFAPQDADGRPVATSPRAIVVGTGGAPLKSFGAIGANSEVRFDDAYGVLALELAADRYSFRFVDADTGAVRDEGSGVCAP